MTLNPDPDRDPDPNQVVWRHGSSDIELTLPRAAHAAPSAEYLPTEGHLRGVLPRTWDDPLTLELAGVAALYAQCVRVRVRIRLRVRGAPNPNPSPNLSLTRCVDGLWLLSYSHPFSAHQAFWLGLG